MGSEEAAAIGDGCTVVLHVDLDCFYAAVEHVRLGIPKETPLAVRQWEGLIAVNYAARAAGVVRHDRVKDAIHKCPGLELVHVETIGGNANDEDHDGKPSRRTSKVSLERYRQASAQVFTVFRRFTSVCERASIDEAYMDVTTNIDDMLNNDVNWNHELERLSEINASGKTTNVVEGGPLDISDAYDRRLLVGAVIADKIRAAVRDDLGYTCSVGIAPNKLLAKIASTRNKPDQQTVVLPRAVASLMQDLPLKKIKLLGGKVGEELKHHWKCNTAGDVQALSREKLIECFGERLGAYAWRAVRGIQNDKVQVKQVPKSMLAAKSFNSTRDIAEMRRWVGVLADELSLRILRDLQQNHRQPRLFQLYYRLSDDHSKSCAMPRAALQLLSSLKPPPSEGAQGSEEHSDDEAASSSGWPGPETVKSLAKILEDFSFQTFQQLIRGSSFSRLAIAATQFEALPNQGTRSLLKYFGASPSKTEGSLAESQAKPLAGVPSTFDESEVKIPGKSELVSEQHQGAHSIRKYFGAASARQELEMQPSARVQECAFGESPSASIDVQLPNDKSHQLQEHVVGTALRLREVGIPCEETVVDLDSIDIREQHRILKTIHRPTQDPRKKRKRDCTISSFFQKSEDCK